MAMEGSSLKLTTSTKYFGDSIAIDLIILPFFVCRKVSWHVWSGYNLLVKLLKIHHNKTIAYMLESKF